MTNDELSLIPEQTKKTYSQIKKLIIQTMEGSKKCGIKRHLNTMIDFFYLIVEEVIMTASLTNKNIDNVTITSKVLAKKFEKIRARGEHLNNTLINLCTSKYLKRDYTKDTPTYKLGENLKDRIIAILARNNKNNAVESAVEIANIPASKKRKFAAEKLSEQSAVRRYKFFKVSQKEAKKRTATLAIIGLVMAYQDLSETERALVEEKNNIKSKIADCLDSLKFYDPNGLIYIRDYFKKDCKELHDYFFKNIPTFKIEKPQDMVIDSEISDHSMSC